MGYTHYFQQKNAVSDEAWSKIVSAVQILCAHSPVTLCNGGGEVGSQPVIENGSIRFNGEDNANDDSHETFYLPKSDSEFNFCKTARKPYDLVVIASLCVADFYAPNAYDIGSDGDAEEWQEGLMFARGALCNYEIQIPERVRG